MFSNQQSVTGRSAVIASPLPSCVLSPYGLAMKEPEDSKLVWQRESRGTIDKQIRAMLRDDFTILFHKFYYLPDEILTFVWEVDEFRFAWICRESWSLKKCRS